MHYHLDPVGGIAGDMFAAAMLDYHRDWQTVLAREVCESGLAPDLGVRALQHSDGTLTGHRFEVKEPPQSHPHRHRHWRDIRDRLDGCHLQAPVRQRAIAIFELLAQAEAEVHGTPVEDVAFHEVGAWDSIADIVAAAWLIERSGAISWSCSPIPLGRGRVSSAHGWLPLPAPATALLLRGFPVFDDGVEGERITPTGAAILKHLNPSFVARTTPALLLGRGYGFGSRRFPGFSNVLQVTVFDTPRTRPDDDRIAVCQFELDDQTPEDLAVGLERLRELPGVLDVMQAPMFGKKGRLAVHVQVLGQISRIDSIVDHCLQETTTLGVRWHTVNRATLTREEHRHVLDGKTMRVKRASRPDGTLTRKIEMNDLADIPGGHEARERQRRRVHARDLDEKNESPPYAEPEE